MQPSSPSSPAPRLAWRSRFEPSGVWESFRCSERTRPRPSLRVASRSVELMPFARADVIAGGEQMAGVQAHAQPLAPAGCLQQRRELVERAPERAARAGGVLQVQLAALALRSAPRAIVSPARAIASPTSPVFAEPGCRTTPLAPIACPTRSEWVSEVSDLRADVRVLAGAVEQVDGVDQDGVDRALGHRLPERARRPRRGRSSASTCAATG